MARRRIRVAARGGDATPPSTGHAGRRPEARKDPSRVAEPHSRIVNAGPLICALLALAAFGVSLANGLVWDDGIVIGSQLRYFESARDVFFPPPGIPQFSKWFYRPLVTVSFLADRALWGDSPLGHHLTVVLMHALSSALVFLLARRLLGAEPSFRKVPSAAAAGALAAGGLFAVHPVHVESVSSIAGRSDVLALIFSMAAVLSFLSPGRRRGLGAVAGSSFLFLALLSKEASLGSLAVLAVLSFSSPGDGSEEDALAGARGAAAGRRRPVWPARLGTASFALVPVLAWWALRAGALPADRGEVLAGLPAATALTEVLGATGFYLAKSILPLSSQAYYPEVPSSPAFIVIGLAAWASLVLLPLLVRRGFRCLAAGQVWFLAFLAPSLAIAISPIGRSRVAERYLYAPSVGICLAAGYVASVVLSEARRRWGPAVSRCFAGGIGLVAAGALIGVCIARNEPWKSAEPFWNKLATDLPDYGLPQLQRGQILYEQGKMEEARKAWQAALVLRYDDAGRALARINLGHIAFSEGRFSAAVEEYREAVRLRPSFAGAHFWLARGLAEQSAERRTPPEQGRRLLEEARAEVARSLEIDPRDPDSRDLASRITAALGP